jgi:hypothetical protein
MQILPRLDEFGLLILLAFVLTFPLLAAASVRWRTKHQLPRPTVFVLVCSAFVYGVTTIIFQIGRLFEMANLFLGAGALSQDHPWLFQASIYASAYGFVVLLPVFAVISILVPVRTSRSWSSLIGAWQS